MSELPDEARLDISLMLCLAPGETSMMDVEFEDPSPSQL